MPTFSNQIIIAGQTYELGSGIQVINFRDNLEYSFVDPIGGQCAPGGAGAPTPGAPPGGIPGLNVGGGGGEDPERVGAAQGSRRYNWRDGLGERNMAGMSPADVTAQLGRLLKHVVIHHDASYTAHSCFGVLCNRGLSTHFIVNHDGGIIQGMDPVLTAYHAGEFNGASIGIDMNNIAVVEGHQNIYSDPAFGGTVDYTTRELIEGRINSSQKTSFAYTEPQYVSLCSLLKLFHDVLDFPLIFPQSDTGGVVTTRLQDPHNFIGFYGHWHCQAGKWDPGPGFDWERVMEGLHGKSNTWPVDLGTGSLRDLRSQESVDEATNVFFRAIEEGPGGGAYPVGLNQEWHDGVHIRCPEGTPIVSIAEGEIILTRNGPNLPLGSPNYVLMRHKIEREIVEYDAQGNAEVSTDIVSWYSLYMHMARLFPNEVPDGTEAPAPVEGEPVEETEPPRDVPGWYTALVVRARQNTPVLVPDPDFELREVENNPRLFEEKARALLRVQEWRHARECIQAGNPFRWIDPNNEESVGHEIGANTLLGYVGQYGEYANGRVEQQPLLHFQVFATSPIFDDTRFDTTVWRRVQGDLSGNSLISTPEIILPLLAASGEETDESGPRVDFGRGRVVTPAEISRFFTSGTITQRHRMRTVIAQHLSEWEIGVDDSLTANIPLTWPWRNEQEFLFWRALHVGYKWLIDDTRALIGMVEGPAPIYTYHPIYLLGWWALNYGRALQGQTFEGLGGEELLAALQAEGELDAEGISAEATNIRLDEIVDFTVRYDDLDDLENGEWDPTTHFMNPLDRR